jgi:predicted GH43/DUF377 family glycosyl hydrolase
MVNTKAYLEKNREKIKEYMRNYYLNHRDKIKSNVKEWASKNKDKQDKYSKKFNNNPKVRKNRKNWEEENKDKVLESKRKYQKRYVLENEQIAKAHNLVMNIPCASSCQICGSFDNLNKHHWRYDKPLLFATLCITCHKIQHIKHFDTSIYRGGGNH